MSVGVTRKERREILEENNLLVELMRVTKHFFPNLREQLSKVKDKRNQSYITYMVEVILWVRILAFTTSCSSMNDINRKFNTDTCIENVNRMLGIDLKELPHGDTINDFLVKVEVSDLEKVRKVMVNRLVEMRSLEQYKYNGKYLVVFDATGIYGFKERHCKHCLTKTHNKGEANEWTEYYHNVLEAKIVAGDFAISLGTEFIENEKVGVSKQDCETKAQKRLAEKIKKEYPRLPIIMSGDSIYAQEPVFQNNIDKEWDYMITFKEGSIPSLRKEFEGVAVTGTAKAIRVPQEKKKVIQEYRYANGIEYGEGTKKSLKNKDVKTVLLNVLEMKETVIELGEEGTEINRIETRFTWITNIKITEKNMSSLAEVGRRRWKIENLGFDEQKNHGYYLEHTYSMNYNAMKCHYLLMQIAHILRQLLENSSKPIKVLRMTLKEITEKILESLRTIILTENDFVNINKKFRISFET